MLSRSTGVILSGNSLGALVALDFASTSPRRTAAIVVSGAPGLSPDANLGTRAPRRLDQSFARLLADRLFYDPACVTDEMVSRCLADLADRKTQFNMVRALAQTRR